MTRKTSTVQLVGGLGSQLGGYFFGKYLELMLDHKVKFDLSEIDRGYTQHKVSITSTSLPGSFVNLRTSEANYLYLLRRLSYVLSSKLRLFNFVTPWPSYSAKVVGSDPVHEAQPKGTYFRGEFFTTYYFRKLQEAGFSFEFRCVNRSQYFLNFLETLGDRRFLSIHIRRGDYVNLSDRFGILGISYYSSGLESLIGQGAKWDVIVIFSDDKSVAREFCDLLATDSQEILIYDPGVESDAAEELELMTYASHHILANSSFSLWGAMLAEKKGARVAPKPWVKGFSEPNNLLPEDIIRVGASFGE